MNINGLGNYDYSFNKSNNNNSATFPSLADNSIWAPKTSNFISSSGNNPSSDSTYTITTYPDTDTTPTPTTAAATTNSATSITPQQAYTWLQANGKLLDVADSNASKDETINITDIQQFSKKSTSQYDKDMAKYIEDNHILKTIGQDDKGSVKLTQIDKAVKGEDSSEKMTDEKAVEILKKYEKQLDTAYSNSDLNFWESSITAHRKNEKISKKDLQTIQKSEKKGEKKYKQELIDAVNYLLDDKNSGLYSGLDTANGGSSDDVISFKDLDKWLENNKTDSETEK